MLLLPASASDAVPPNIEGCDLVPVPGETIVEIETGQGTLVIELYRSVAPRTVHNFLAYVARGDYADTFVHRTDPRPDGEPFVIQAGGYRTAGINFAEPIETEDPIPNEPCLSNVTGTVAMAKLATDPNSATSQWFVNLNDNSTPLDTSNEGFTVFGELISGSLDVALDIYELEQAPDAPIPPYFGVIPFPFWDIFLKSPIHSDLVEGDYGCFDTAASGIVLAADPMSTQDWEPNESSDLAFYLASSSCAGAGTGGSPPFECAPPGRRVILIDPDTGQYLPDGDAPLGFAETLLSCEDIAASTESLDTRYLDIADQLEVKLVKTAYTIAVPEPGAGIAGLAALLSVVALHRGRRRLE
jgi:cyclophilin family peptidyl-prolyl cis-trans isomerase